MESTQYILGENPLIGNSLLFQHPWIIWIIILAALWIIPWKGVALWKSAKNGQRWWFIVMLVVNTLAILEIIYIFGFSKKRKE